MICIMILKPVSQFPVHYSVRLLPWRNGLGLEALSFSVSIAGPTSCLLPLCRWRGARMALVLRSCLCGHWCCGSCPHGLSLHLFMHWLSFLYQVLCVPGIALCSANRVGPGWWDLPACPATAAPCLLSSATLSSELLRCFVFFQPL